MLASSASTSRRSRTGSARSGSRPPTTVGPSLEVGTSRPTLGARAESQESGGGPALTTTCRGGWGCWSARRLVSVGPRLTRLEGQLHGAERVGPGGRPADEVDEPGAAHDDAERARREQAARRRADRVARAAAAVED